jgi:hypothetical protein
MNTSIKQKAAIDSMLQVKWEQFGLSERLRIYKSELRSDVVTLLKQYYPNNDTDKYAFYAEAFNSKLGFYDAELLLRNLFLEKSSVSIANHLLHAGILQRIISKYLSPLMDDYLTNLSNRFNQNSKITEEDSIKFLKSIAKCFVEDIIELDWDVDNPKSQLNRKFLDWFGDNITDSDASLVYLIFIKIWNSDFNEKESFNERATVFYHLLIQRLKRFLDDGTYPDYFQFVHSTQNIKSELFDNTIFCPMIDSNESNRYKDYYIIKRNEYNRLLNQVSLVTNLNSDNSFVTLLSEVHENAPEYLLRRVNEIINEKISHLDYPDPDEIEKIWHLKQDIELNKLKDFLMKKFYLYERV